jgi:hypothetical protein
MYEVPTCDGLVDGPIIKYPVTGPSLRLGGWGYLRIGFSNHRVAFIETTSPLYRTSDRIGVGAKIPYGKQRTMDGVHFKLFAPSYGGTYWIGNSKYVPYPKNGQPGNAADRRWVKIRRHTAFTVLTIGGGNIADVLVARGDYDIQF